LESANVRSRAWAILHNYWDWGRKTGKQTFYGYKNHVVPDEEHKFIRGYGVTGAATHDSEPHLDVMPEKAAYPDQEAFGDSAYSGADAQET
jgi:hypothetical protein